MFRKPNRKTSYSGWAVKWLVLLSILVLSIGCGSSSDDPEPSSDPVRESAQGPVCGLDEGTMLAFRGIPYAQPPLGDLRFAPTEPLADVRADTLECKSFGNVCPQLAGGLLVGEEDCLTLNIFTPKDAGADAFGYPVMVWIHGGAYIQGSGSSGAYDLPDLVERGVIVVTFNYRLGALGFLPHPALTAEQGQSGNYGLMDQQEALRWVQANIAQFGGDPNNVTIFGESAGGHSVMTHLAAPDADALFQKAIVQSGSYSPFQLPLDTGYMYYGAPFAATADCTGSDAEIAACFRDLSVDGVIAAQGDAWYVPVTGGDFLPESIYMSLATGAFHNDKPVLIGGNRNEGTLFTALDFVGTPPEYYDDNDAYLAAVARLLGQSGITDAADIAKIANDYLGVAEAELGQLPNGDPHPNRFRLAHSKVWTDHFFACRNMMQWEQLADHTPTYAYWFTDANAPFPPAYAALSAFEDMGMITFGASHAFEIQYVFGRVQEQAVVSGEQIALSLEMIEFWTNFAKTGAPSDAPGVWDVYARAVGPVMRLDTPGATPVNVSAFSDAHRCAYWENPVNATP